MSPRAVKLPDIGEGVTEAEIVEWRVAVGDTVAEDQIIGSVMTDKAAVEIPSPSAGTIVALGGEIGDVLAVGAELVRIEPGGKGSAAEGDRSSVPPELSAPEGTDGGDTEPDTAGEHGASDPDAVVGTDDAAGGSNHVATDPVGTDTVRATIANEPRRRARAAPAVRRRARACGVALHAVPGTGPEGRVTHEDLDRHLAARRDGGPRDAVGGQAGPDGEQAIRLVGMRRRTARRMELSSRRIPHFSYIDEVDMTLIEALREGLDDDEHRPRLSPLPFIVLALVRALEAFPQMNARYDDEAETVHRYAARHVGIATRTDDGLVVPVVRHAESLDVRALADEIARLAAAARTKRLTRAELTGGTVTVSSLGALGGLASTPIINHPEVAIVGINRIAERPVCRDGRIEVRRMMNLSASFDHRVVDGDEAARFVQRIRAALERPGALLVPD